jgi:hypothetical protein
MTGADLYEPSRAPFRIVLIGLGRDPVLSVRDPGARVLFGESVLQGMECGRSFVQLVPYRRRSGAKPAGAARQTLPGLTAGTDWQARDRVLTAYPELRTTIAGGMIRNQTGLADALAERAGQAAGSLYPQLLAGAAVSAFRAACNVWAPETGTAGLRALVGEAFDRLAAGLPPSRPDPASADAERTGTRRLFSCGSWI